MQKTAIEQLRYWNNTKLPLKRKEDILIQRERYWQNRLKTFAPEGMNKRSG